MLAGKWIGIVIAFLILLSGPLAQASDTELRFGQNYSTFKGSDYNQNQTTQQYEAGFAFTFPVAPLTVHLELLATQLGGQSLFPGQTAKDTLTYAQAPVLLGLSVLPGIEVYGGYYFSRFLYSMSAPAGNSKETPSNSLFNDWDQGLVYGVGMQFGFLRIDGRYNVSAVTIVRPNSSAALQTDSGGAAAVNTSDEDILNYWSTLSVGIVF